MREVYPIVVQRLKAARDTSRAEALEFTAC